MTRPAPVRQADIARTLRAAVDRHWPRVALWLLIALVIALGDTNPPGMVRAFATGVTLSVAFGLGEANAQGWFRRMMRGRP